MRNQNRKDIGMMLVIVFYEYIIEPIEKLTGKNLKDWDAFKRLDEFLDNSSCEKNPADVPAETAYTEPGKKEEDEA